MAYILDSVTIRNPKEFDEDNDTQEARNRTLSGANTSDFFGSNKRIWTLNYENAKKADYDAINTIYQSFLSTGTAKTWQITETNYTVSSTNVLVYLKTRGFRIRGSDYLSNFTLTLIEA